MILTEFDFMWFLQNTYTNAEKLLAAAEELAQTGECSPNEIYAVARQLEQHVGYARPSPFSAFNLMTFSE